MMPRSYWLTAATALVLCPGLAAQTIEIVSTFDTGTEGWSAIPLFQHRPTGGNPGGFLFMDNPETDPVAVAAPAKFHGDLRAFDGGVLSFDGNMLRRGAEPDHRFWTDEEAAPYGGNYGTVTIRGADGSTAKKDLEPGLPPVGSWRTYTTPFTAQAFGMSLPAWLRLLASVTSITVSMEAIYGEEQQGFDNFIIRAMAPPLAITTASLPPGEVGQRYQQAVLAAGGAPPYRFVVTGLPRGLDYDPRPPFIVGNPERAGTYQVTITVSDSIGTNAPRTFPLEIAASTRRLRIDTNSLQTSAVGQPFSQTLQASGGAPFYSWEWTTAVPPWLEIASATGRIFGTPPAALYLFSTELAVQVTARDTAGATARQSFILRIGVKPEIYQSDLPPGQVGARYDYGLFVNKGQSPYRWDRVGTLPAGLTIAPATGRITGVPTTAGTFDFRVYVEDKFVQSDEERFRIVIGTAPVSGVKLSRNEVACKSVVGGASATTSSISVTGDPGQRVAVTTTGAAPWFRAEGIPEMVPDLPLPTTVRFVCDPTGLPVGENRTQIRIGGQPVGVNFQVKPQNPKLQVNPSVVDITGPSKDIVVTLTGAAKSAAPGVTVTTPPGVTVNASSATVSVEQPLKLPVERAGPPPAGSQAGTMRVQAGSDPPPPVDVPVRVYGERGITELVPDIISFINTPGTQNQPLYLFNRSDRPVDVTAQSDSPAVTVSPTTGRVSAGTRLVLNVRKTGDLTGGALVRIISGDTTKLVPLQETPPPPGGIDVSPTSIFFTLPAPTPKVVRLTNLRLQGFPFNCTALPLSAVSPQIGTIPAGGSVNISITGAATGQAVQQGSVTCAGPGGAATVSIVTIPPVPNCVPRLHIPRLTNLGENFLLTGGFGYVLNAEVRDNCGNLVNGAFVSLNGLDNDEYVTFTSLGDGQYVGSLHASEGLFDAALYSGTGAQGLTGRVAISGEFLAAPPDLPVLDGDSPYHGASFEEYSGAGPGTYLTLIGKGLAATQVLASTIPLPAQLSDTTVLLAGRALPLHFVSPNQINVLVPYGLPRNTPLELVVRRGNNRVSTPAPVTIGDAAPGIFTINSTGKGPGIVVDENFRLITETNPGRAGRVGILLATGLGDVTPPLAADQQTALDLRRAVLPVSVRVGGRTAQVLFAGLLPGFAGVYQVNFLFPEGVAGGELPLEMQVGGHASNQVTVEVR